jgi:hypothetical protein
MEAMSSRNPSNSAADVLFQVQTFARGFPNQPIAQTHLGDTSKRRHVAIPSCLLPVVNHAAISIKQAARKVTICEHAPAVRGLSQSGMPE